MEIFPEVHSKKVPEFHQRILSGYQTFYWWSSDHCPSGWLNGWRWYLFIRDTLFSFSWILIRNHQFHSIPRCFHRRHSSFVTRFCARWISRVYKDLIRFDHIQSIGILAFKSEDSGLKNEIKLVCNSSFNPSRWKYFGVGRRVTWDSIVVVF